MDAKLLCVLAVTAAIVYVTIADKTSGNFQYGDRNCEWKELGQKNSHERTLKITCNGNKKKKEAQLKCSYSGNAHSCSWYNKHVKGFFECLVTNLVKDASSVCNPGSVKCHNHCEDITFNKGQDNHIRRLILERIELEEYTRYDSEDSQIIESDSQSMESQFDFEPYI